MMKEIDSFESVAFININAADIFMRAYISRTSLI